MMKDANLQSRGTVGQSSWSNRILLLSLAGIFFLTFYPFRFEYRESARFLFPFSLNGWGKGINAADIILNILLFVPFGFGLAGKLRERGKSKAAALLVAYISGAVLSYLVEFLQIYIPPRDSGWGDIITNSSGALIGAWVFELAGVSVVAWFSRRERELETWLSLPKIGVFIALYIGFWSVVVKPLQKQGRLTNWALDSYLAVGDSASLRPGPPWKGRIHELDIWNRALPANQARKITSGQSANGQDSAPLIAYRFSGEAPFHDRQHFLPDLDWASEVPAGIPSGAALDGESWLISTGPVAALVSSIENSGQFALRLTCEPAETFGADARILSIGSPSGASNVELSQYGSALAFWFRDKVSMRRARMTWVVPHVFSPNQTRNLLLSFNGSTLVLYVDGREYAHPYELGPGVVLAGYIRRVKAVELDGYEYVLYAMIFFPIGCLLGFAGRRPDVGWTSRLCFLSASLLLPALLLEWVLADVAGREVSLSSMCLSVLVGLAGSLWINADHAVSGAPRGERETVSAR